MNREQTKLFVAGMLGCAALFALGCERDEETSNQPTRVAEKPAAQEEARPPHAALLNVDDPNECAACHAEIVAEWKSSMHAHAHQSRDPIYAAMRKLRIEREGAQLAGRCAQCHGPRDPSNPESTVSRGGVTCASCHLVEALDRAGGKKQGAQALKFSERTMRGPHDIEEAPAAPHGVGKAAPFIQDGKSLCLVCHDAMQNAQGAATCTTGTEYAAVKQEKSCAECHMPAISRPSGAASQRKSHRSHGFLGPHQLYGEGRDEAFLASAIKLTGELNKQRLTLSLQNESGHSVPSGFPGRMILVKVVGFDASDQVVWSNWSDDPMKEDPRAVLNKVYVDEAGHPTMPPYAAKLERDSRLTPGELRKLEWQLPPAVQRAEVQLIYRLLPPVAAKKLGLEGSPLAQPQVFVRLEVPRGD